MANTIVKYFYVVTNVRQLTSTLVKFAAISSGALKGVIYFVIDIAN